MILYTQVQRMSDSDDSFGPSLPPGFEKPSKNDSSSSEDDASYGPALPPMINTSKSVTSSTKSVIGPVLPPHLHRSKSQSSDSDPDSNSDSDSDDESDNCKKQKRIGPSLPPYLSGNEKVNDGDSIGPVLPSRLAHLSKEPSEPAAAAAAAAAAGPSLPPGFSRQYESSDESSDDEYMIGPSMDLIADEKDKSAAVEVEKRAQKMKDKLTGKAEEDEGPKGRESWMTELPGNLQAQYDLGLTSRQFRKNAAPEQDSSWTETPEEKKRKEKEGRKKRRRDKDEFVPTERDTIATKEIEAYNKKHRPDSLYEMHQKEIKKKKKKEKKKNKDKVQERRPFDRDLDLQVNRLDDAQRRAMIKRSQELGSRFKSGGTGTSFL